MTTKALIYQNGSILTVDQANTTVEAVGTIGERIVATGQLADVQKLMPADARIIDLQGRTMIPSFIDPHGHFPDSGFVACLRADLSSPPKGSCKNLHDIFDRLRKKVEKTPKGEWVMGAALDETSLAEFRMPTRNELDAISSEHPIWVIHSSGHCGVANSLALARQGISEETLDPLGGRYLRDVDTGLLNGYIEGLSAMGEMSDTHFLINSENFKIGFDASREEYLSHGVTLAQNAWAANELLELFHEVSLKGDPGIDLILLPIAELEPEFSATGLGKTWPDNRHIILGPRKLLTDGSFLMRTALLSEPYYTGAPGKEPDFGLAYMEREILFAEVQKLHDMGFQIHTHCNGDASADMYLDAIENAISKNPRSDHRHTLIHGQVMRIDQMDRCKNLGVTISFFSAHIFYWGDKHYELFLGPERAQNISPAKWAQEAGVRFTIHNDASVTPTRPLHLMHCAVNRKTQSGRVLGEHQRISAESALRAHTIDAAWQVFQENERGSIEVGKLAEFAILSENPIENPDQLGKIKVMETIRYGKSVWKNWNEISDQHNGPIDHD
ncbi:MAG: amidohydrolase [Salaquimonas sp.]